MYQTKRKQAVVCVCVTLFFFYCYIAHMNSRRTLVKASSREIITHSQKDSMMTLQNEKRYKEDLNTTVVKHKPTFADEDNTARVSILRHQCNRHQLAFSRTHQGYKNIIVDNKRKVLFCYIPKIACSQWKRIFLILSDQINDTATLNLENVHLTYNSKIPLLSQYSPEERLRMIREYKKYIFVRNPFERILSAYRDKLYGEIGKSGLMKLYGRDIIRKYRPNASTSSLQHGNDVTFLEFVKYVTDQRFSKLEPHWDMYHNLCHPCEINYDFIGRFETLKKDSEFVMKDIGVPENLEFFPRSENYDPIETHSVLGTYYSEIPLTYIAKLWQMYKYDFYLFGYSFAKTLALIPSLS